MNIFFILFCAFSVVSAILSTNKRHQNVLRRQSRKLAKNKSRILRQIDTKRVDLAYDEKCWVDRGLGNPVLKKKADCIRLTCNADSLELSFSKDLIPKRSDENQSQLSAFSNLYTEVQKSRKSLKNAWL